MGSAILQHNQNWWTFYNKYKSIIRVAIISNIIKWLSCGLTVRGYQEFHYQKQWIVHCAKPNNNHKKNVQYLGRYVKRPAIAESKLRHYDGNNVRFDYLDHSTKSFRQFKCSAQEFIARFIRHFPDQNFRLIRYYGFLANRIWAEMLPLVYKFIQQDNQQQTPSPSWIALMLTNFKCNPLVCIVCQADMQLSTTKFGKSSIELMAYHQQLALMKVCR